MKLMILGATGAVGSQVLNQASKDGRFETIVAPTRRPLASPGQVHNPVTPFDLPLPPADWWAVDGVICCLGTTLKQAGSKRSEEHTSELQSRPHLVCRLLLEKKNILNIFCFC